MYGGRAGGEQWVGRRSAGVSAAHGSAWICAHIQRSREVSSYYRWVRKAENPGRHPQKAELTRPAPGSV